MFNRRLFLVTLTIILVALFIIQTTGSGIGADVPLLHQFPSLQAWIDTSPYAHEPISISSGTVGVNVPE